MHTLHQPSNALLTLIADTPTTPHHKTLNANVMVVLCPQGCVDCFQNHGELHVSTILFFMVAQQQHVTILDTVLGVLVMHSVGQTKTIATYVQMNWEDTAPPSIHLAQHVHCLCVESTNALINCVINIHLVMHIGHLDKVVV
jgi:hypothetical protein